MKNMSRSQKCNSERNKRTLEENMFPLHKINKQHEAEYKLERTA